MKITEKLADEMQDAYKAVLKDVAGFNPIFGASVLIASALTLCQANGLDSQRLFEICRRAEIDPEEVIDMHLQTWRDAMSGMEDAT